MFWYSSELFNLSMTYDVQSKFDFTSFKACSFLADLLTAQAPPVDVSALRLYYTGDCGEISWLLEPFCWLEVCRCAKWLGCHLQGSPVGRLCFYFVGIEIPWDSRCVCVCVCLCVMSWNPSQSCCWMCAENEYVWVCEEGHLQTTSLQACQNNIISGWSNIMVHIRNGTFRLVFQLLWLLSILFH